MYNREEMGIAITSTGAMLDPVFSGFMSELSKLHPHAVYTQEGTEYISDLIYNTDSFDKVVSWLLVIYNELVQNREPTNVATVYKNFYNSRLLGYLKSLCLENDNSKSKNNATADDALTNIIVLLNIYYHGDKNEQ